LDVSASKTYKDADKTGFYKLYSLFLLLIVSCVFGDSSTSVFFYAGMSSVIQSISCFAKAYFEP